MGTHLSRHIYWKRNHKHAGLPLNILLVTRDAYKVIAFRLVWWACEQFNHYIARLDFTFTPIHRIIYQVMLSLWFATYPYLPTLEKGRQENSKEGKEKWCVLCKTSPSYAPPIDRGQPPILMAFQSQIVHLSISLQCGHSACTDCTVHHATNLLPDQSLCFIVYWPIVLISQYI